MPTRYAVSNEVGPTQGHPSCSMISVSRKVGRAGCVYFVDAGIMAIRKPTVLYAPVAARPSPIETHWQLDPLAYQEPPRISFTFLPRSAPLVATISVSHQFQTLPAMSK